MNKYKEILKNTVLFIVLLPINIILVLMESLRGAVFYLLDINYIKDDINCLEFLSGKHAKDIEKLHEKLDHIENNLMYDATPDELNKRIKSIEHLLSGDHPVPISKRLNMLEKKTFGLILEHQDDGVFIGNRTYDKAEKRLKDIERDINELQLSLENMKPKDLGTFNFINDKLTQLELAQIEAELDGEKVAREEHDWHYEQKAKDKQIQERMKKDEYAFICTEDDINC